MDTQATNINHIKEKTSLMVKKAKEGSLEAQLVCWEVYNRCLKDGYLPTNELAIYIGKILLDVHLQKEKIESYLPFFKSADKIVRDRKRMLNTAFVKQLLRNTTIKNSCTMVEAVDIFIKYIEPGCSLEAEPKGKEFFRRLNTPEKIKKELRYFAQNYSKWHFYLDELTIKGIKLESKSNHKITI